MSRKSTIIGCLLYLIVSIWSPLTAKKFVVTGGCGFIGSHLVDALIEEGHEVIVIDNLSTGHIENLNPKATLIEADICDKEAITQAFSQGIDGCFHLAAISSVQKSNEEWLSTHKVNVTGTVTVFEAAIPYKFPIIYASSAAIYGNHSKHLSENDRPTPLTAYSVDKYSSELHAGIAYWIHGIPTTGLRFFNVYGPRQNPLSPYSGVIAIFTRKILNDEPIRVDGSGKQARDFIYVSDVVRALMTAMQKKLEKPVGADVYNVCTGKPTTLLDLITHLEKIIGHKAKRISAPARQGDIYFLVGVPDKLRKELGVKAQVSLNQGLRKTIESLETPDFTAHGLDGKG